MQPAAPRVEAGLTGLSHAEAAVRLARDGANALGAAPAHAWLRLLREVASEPMFALLLMAGGIYLLLGDGQEAAMLLAFVVLIMGVRWPRNIAPARCSTACEPYPARVPWWYVRASPAALRGATWW